MQIKQQKFFLAANSAEGFVSHFGDSYIPGTWRAYIVKGGPGTGKSSFMKYVAAKAADYGYGAVLCPCSSDPDSLDGVIIEDLKTVILDGTAPHVVEPQLPGACENIIDLGRFWDSDKLFSNADKITAAASKNSRLHKTVAAYLSAAGEVLYDNLKISRIYTDRAAAMKFAFNLSRRYIPKSGGNCGGEFVRFIGGVTPKGIVGFSKSVTDYYERVIVIEDKFGGACGEIMKCLRAFALEKGHNIITLKSPLLPGELIDGVLIPELSLAFVREHEFIKFDTTARRIHSRRFTNKSLEKKYRGRTLFNRKVANQLLFGAASTLAAAKLSHDELEKYYIESMDFEAIARFGAETAEKILKKA